MGFISDISYEIRELKPERRDLLNLGLVFLVALGLIGAFVWWRGKPAGPWLVGLGIVFGAWGLIWPAGLKPVYKVWMSLAAILGWFMSRLLLGLVFYLAVTPIGWIMRLVGKDVLDLKMKDRASYWHLRDEEYDPVRTEKMY